MGNDKDLKSNDQYINDEFDRIQYISHIIDHRGDRQQTRKDSVMPTISRLAEYVAGYNFTKRPEFHARGVILRRVKVTNELIGNYVFTPDDLRRATDRNQAVRDERLVAQRKERFKDRGVDEVVDKNPGAEMETETEVVK